MLKAALTSCNLSGPLTAKYTCVTLHIPTVSRDKVPPAPHEAVTDVVMLKKELNLTTSRWDILHGTYCRVQMQPRRCAHHKGSDLT